MNFTLTCGSWASLSPRPICTRAFIPLACNPSPRKARAKSRCFSNNVTAIPRRASRKASAAPAGPAPMIRTLPAIVRAAFSDYLVGRILGEFSDKDVAQPQGKAQFKKLSVAPRECASPPRTMRPFLISLGHWVQQYCCSRSAPAACPERRAMLVAWQKFTLLPAVCAP